MPHRSHGVLRVKPPWAVSRATSAHTKIPLELKDCHQLSKIHCNSQISTWNVKNWGSIASGFSFLVRDTAPSPNYIPNYPLWNPPLTSLVERCVLFWPPRSLLWHVSTNCPMDRDLWFRWEGVPNNSMQH